MIRRRAIIGVCMLCALAISAVAAQGASAAAGTTAYTCAPAEGTAEGFSKEHCTPTDAVAKEAKWKHVAITSPTSITGTNANTASSTTAAAPSVLSGTAAGVETEIECSTVGGEGTLSNSTNGEEMVASGSGVIKYTGCVVLKPSGQSCAVTGGAVTTNKLVATTKEQGEFVQFKPEGEKFAEVPISGCTVNTGLNKTFPVTGSVKIPPNGATLTSTVAGTIGQKTLKFAGQNAGLGGSLTLKMAPEGTKPTNPISVTNK